MGVLNQMQTRIRSTITLHLNFSNAVFASFDYYFDMTEPEPLQQINRTFVVWGRRKFSYVAASRFTTGNHALYKKLEGVLADFFAVETATLLSSGYMTNLVVAQALAGNFSHVLLDERAHPSLADAAVFFDCPVLKFKHRD